MFRTGNFGCIGNGQGGAAIKEKWDGHVKLGFQCMPYESGSREILTAKVKFSSLFDWRVPPFVVGEVASGVTSVPSCVINV